MAGGEGEVCWQTEALRARGTIEAREMWLSQGRRSGEEKVMSKSKPGKAEKASGARPQDTDLNFLLKQSGASYQFSDLHINPG